MTNTDKLPDITAPPTFQDGAAPPNSWTIKLTGELIEDVLVNAQLDLIPDDQNYQAVFDLVVSPRKLLAVLWECVKRQAESKGVSKPQFSEALDGAAFGRGWEALVNSIYFFIHSMNADRAKMYLGMFKASMKVRAAESEMQIEVLESQSTDESMKSALAEIKSRVQTEISQQLENCASSLLG